MSILDTAKSLLPPELHAAIEKRAATGYSKYGVTLDEHGMSSEQAKANELQELLDAVQYAIKAGSLPRARAYAALARELCGDMENPAFGAGWKEQGEPW